MRGARRLAGFALVLLAGLGACAQRPSALPAAEAAGPATVRVLRVGTSGDYPPFSVRGADGSYDGFDVAVARAFASDAGMQLELVPFSWPDLERHLLAGDFDVAMSGVTVRGDRFARAPMTAAVARASAVLVAPAGGGSLSPDAAGRKVAVNRGGHLERVARATLPAARIVTLDDNRSLPAVLRSGEADAVVTDSLEVEAFAAEGVKPRIVRALAEDRKAYWVSPRAPGLAEELDRWLAAREADGTLPRLRARHFGEAAAPAHAGLDPASAHAADLVARRLLLMPLVAAAKQACGAPLEVPGREAVVYARAEEAAGRAGLAPGPYLELVRAQVEAAKAVQRAAIAGAKAEEFASDAAACRQAKERLQGELRPAIDRIDDALRRALARSAPLAAPAPRLADAVGRDAPVPGLDAALAARLGKALAGVRPQISLERPHPPF